MSAVVHETEQITIRPLTPNLGAEIFGVDFSRDLDDATFRQIHDAFLRYQVLLFSSGELSPASQVAFARRFGEVQIHVMNQYHAGGFPELYRLSNLDENGKPNGKHPDQGTLIWHTDGSWRRVTGHATIIYGEVMPDAGGDTLFLRHVRRIRAPLPSLESTYRQRARHAQSGLLTQSSPRSRTDD